MNGLSKSKGQVLRVAASLQVLFALHMNCEEQPTSSAGVISEDAIKAAINFVEVCCQQTAYIAGRDKIAEELAIYKTGTVYREREKKNGRVTTLFL